jgi:hypothetical protein
MASSDARLGLSPPQQAALEEFRVAVACIPNKPEEDDRYYLRWLRARKYNVQKALVMFRNVSKPGTLFLIYFCGSYHGVVIPILQIIQMVEASFGAQFFW